MKLKKFISLVLLAVYLFAAGGQAIVSLSCHCALAHQRAAHACCVHCAHNHSSDIPAKESLHNTCCSHEHSTEIELYTSTSSDDETVLKCSIIELPASLAAVTEEIPRAEIRCERIFERQVLAPRPVFLHAAALRGPPVLA